MRQRQHQAAIPSWSVLPDLQPEHAVHSPPSPPTTSTSFSYEERFSGYQSGNTEFDSIKIIRSIIDSIYEVVQSFPQHMLFLNTPCVVEVRRQNHFVQDAAGAQRLSIPSPNSSVYSLPLDQLQRPSRRRRTTAKLLAPLLRASLAKHFLPQNTVTLPYVTRPSSRRPTASGVLSLSEPPPPNLSPFQHIFPSTQDWWRTILYAHLIAYNYICTTQVSSQYLMSEVPRKASRTLGISRGYSSQSTANTALDARLDEIERGLVSCITWITNCMAGENSALTDTMKVQTEYERDSILVRALAEIVKVCEGSDREAANAREVR